MSPRGIQANAPLLRSRPPRGWLRVVPCLAALLLATSPSSAADPRPGDPLVRLGDEIVVCGQLFHTTSRVVLWMDPGGYDAYRTERRFGPLEAAPAKNESAAAQSGFSQRKVALTPEQAEQVRGGGWDLGLLREVVDQFVIHYDARGTSRGCFEILHDRRGLSVQFMLDLDGTIYQTLDAKEGAWHATVANGRSIGIEIANVGAYPKGGPNPFARWYDRDGSGATRILVPEGELPARVDRRNWIPRPIRAQPVVGKVQGQELRQYDLTPEQYDALIRLTATLCRVFPKIRCDYPRDASGLLIPRKLVDDELAKYQGILGHYHVQTNKVDPGPAFQWDRLIDGARARLAP